MADEISAWAAVGAGLGRGADLATLLADWEEARRHGSARIALVTGPVGVGKTHFFGELRRAAQARGAEVFEGSSGKEVGRPYGLFAELLREVLAFLGHTGVPPSVLAPLSMRLSPIWGKVPIEAEPRVQREALLDAVAELFSLVSQSVPVFLFPDLDDADAASAELLRYVIATAAVPQAPFAGLFVASSRSGSTLELLDLPRAGRAPVRVVALRSFGLGEIREYLARDEVVERLYQATGGMPGLLSQLGPPEAPSVELLEKRIASLAQADREVLEVIVVSPKAVSAEVVGAVLERMGRSAAQVRERLENLSRRCWLVASVVGGQPLFRSSEAQREALERVLPSNKAAQVVGHLADVFGQQEDWSARAELLLRSGFGPIDVSEVERAADKLVERSVLGEAVGLYERLLALVPREVRAPLHVKIGDLEEARGHWRSSLRHALRARRGLREDGQAELAIRVARRAIKLGKLGLAERVLRAATFSGTGLAAAEAAAARAEVEVLRGNLGAALEVYRGAETAFGAHPEPLARVRNAAGRAWLVRGDLGRARACFEENLRIARSLDRVALASEALLNLGVVAQKAGEAERASSLYVAAARGAPRPVEARAWANVGSLHVAEGRFDLALDELTRALRAFSRAGMLREAAHAASNLARLHLLLGDLDKASELSNYSLGIAQGMGERYLQASALLNSGTILVERDDGLGALGLLEEARELFQVLGSIDQSTLASALKARAHLLLGERTLAERELERSAGGAGGSGAPGLEAELVRAELCLASGDLLGAGRAMARARDAALTEADWEAPVRVGTVAAKIRRAGGDLAGARVEILRAARLLEELVERVPPARRRQFLALPRWKEVLESGGVGRLPGPLPVSGTTPPGDSYRGLVGSSKAFAKVVRQLEPVARTQTTVLLRGESGTGKEVVAQALHDLSLRRAMPLVKVNCAAMVEDLLLSELFGHEKGAFTGAVRERKGRFELAEGGTLFLDEIGDISPKCQIALLRVLQEKEFERVGGVKTLKVDVRVVCATNRPLEKLVAEGRFREDLFYRLKGVTLELPPLRDRVEDLPELAAHFLHRIGRERGESPKRLSPATVEVLGRHAWPGNVRELENVLASATIFSEGETVEPSALAHIAELAALVTTVPSEGPAPEPGFVDQGPLLGEIDYYGIARRRGISLKELRHEVEADCIRKALGEANGNISEAARLLRMKRSRLSQIINGEAALQEARHA